MYLAWNRFCTDQAVGGYTSSQANASDLACAYRSVQSNLVTSNELCACVGTARAMCCGEQERRNDGVLGTDCNAVGVVSHVLHFVMCPCDAPQA